LLLDDENKTLLPELKKETDLIFKHTQILNHYSEIDSIADYDEKPKKLIKKIRLTQIDRLLQKFL